MNEQEPKNRLRICQRCGGNGYVHIHQHWRHGRFGRPRRIECSVCSGVGAWVETGSTGEVRHG